MPDSGPHNTPARIVPEFVQCPQHGAWHHVTEQRILTHTDDSRHVYAVAVCDVGGRIKHELQEYVRRADAP